MLFEVTSPSLVVTEVAAFTLLTEVMVWLDVRSPSTVVTEVIAALSLVLLEVTSSARVVTDVSTTFFL